MSSLTNNAWRQRKKNDTPVIARVNLVEADVTVVVISPSKHGD